MSIVRLTCFLSTLLCVACTQTHGVSLGSAQRAAGSDESAGLPADDDDDRDHDEHRDEDYDGLFDGIFTAAAEPREAADAGEEADGGEQEMPDDSMTP